MRPEALVLDLGMPLEVFLAEYWQRRPLLVRQAFANFRSPIDGNDLAGLACEDIALSRLVRLDRDLDRWSVEHGPFAEDAFASLGERDWTLLVQDVEKLLPEDFGPLRAAFRFLPDWRVDDIMVSYAVDGGSVGPHLDQYDVFLLQAQGRRRWQIDDSGRHDPRLREDCELKLLERFVPSKDWLLGPGDLLYLPPGVPHHGVAEGECMTFSIGMRAPSLAELLLDQAETLAEALPEALRYRDPPLEPATEPARIDAEALAALRRALDQASRQDDRAFADWFGRFITRYRSAQSVLPPERPWTLDELEAAAHAGASFWRNPWSRYAWIEDAAGARIFLAGEAWPASPGLARTLERSSAIDGPTLLRLPAADRRTVLELLNAGHYAAYDD